jgi:large subunit ribosomal protein L31
MKPNIHPKLNRIKVHCGCGNEFETLATVSELRLELCGACHPFYTGKKRNIAAAGRVQRFEEKYKAVGNAPVAAKKPAAPKAKKK